MAVVTKSEGKSFALGVGLLFGSAPLLLLPRFGFELTMILLLIWSFPLKFVVGFLHRSRFKKALGVWGRYDYQYADTQGRNGVAIDKSSKRLLLWTQAQTATYDFSEIREWAIRNVDSSDLVYAGNSFFQGLNTYSADKRAKSKAEAKSGLYVTVKDIDHPEWVVNMNTENQKRWFEILKQLVNGE